MNLNIKKEIESLKVMVVIGYNVQVRQSSDEFYYLLKGLISERQQNLNPEIKDSIRNLLKEGGFKPSGRNKPASEYLHSAAREGRFPFISNVVDAANYISLLTRLPVSLLDLDVLGNNIVIRYGRKGENYIFNQSGQEIDLCGLICVCREEEDGTTIPLGNPIKDSVASKITSNTKSVVGFIYAPNNLFSDEELIDYGEQFMELLIKFCHAYDVENILC